MLTTKNRGAPGRAALLTLSAAVWFIGCTPAGPRALLDGERLLAREGQSGRFNAWNALNACSPKTPAPGSFSALPIIKPVAPGRPPMLTSKPSP
jgi:hypothetical protein